MRRNKQICLLRSVAPSKELNSPILKLQFGRHIEHAGEPLVFPLNSVPLQLPIKPKLGISDGPAFEFWGRVIGPEFSAGYAEILPGFVSLSLCDSVKMN